MIKPLYAELMKTPNGRRLRCRFTGAPRSGYHPIAQTAIDKIMRPQ